MTKLFIEVTEKRRKNFPIEVEITCIGEQLKIEDIKEILLHAYRAVIAEENEKTKKAQSDN